MIGEEWRQKIIILLLEKGLKNFKKIVVNIEYFGKFCSKDKHSYLLIYLKNKK